MAVSLVQTSGAQSASLAVTAESPTISTVGAGHLVVCSISAVTATGTATVLSVSDSASQAWTSAVTANYLGPTHDSFQIFYKANSAAITTVTANSTQGGDLSVQFYEVSGIATTSPLDVTATSALTGASASTHPTITASSATTQAAEIAIGSVGCEGGVYTLGSVTANWNAETALYTTDIYSMQFPFYQILSSTATLTLAGTLSNSTRWGVVIATFKAAGVTSLFAAPPAIRKTQAVNRAASF